MFDLARVIDRIAAGEMATDVQVFNRADEISRRASAELPDACGGARPVALLKSEKIFIRLPHQQGGACRGTATTTFLRLEYRDAQAIGGKSPRDRRAGHTGADDRHVDGEVASQRREFGNASS